MLTSSVSTGVFDRPRWGRVYIAANRLILNVVLEKHTTENTGKVSMYARIILSVFSVPCKALILCRIKEWSRIARSFGIIEKLASLSNLLFNPVCDCVSWSHQPRAIGSYLNLLLRIPLKYQPYGDPVGQRDILYTPIKMKLLSFMVRYHNKRRCFERTSY